MKHNNLHLYDSNNQKFTLRAIIESLSFVISAFLHILNMDRYRPRPNAFWKKEKSLNSSKYLFVISKKYSIIIMYRLQ